MNKKLPIALMSIPRKITITFTLLLLSVYSVRAQGYDGDVVIKNKAQLDALTQPGGELYQVTSINGDLFIGDRENGSDIVDLMALSSLTTVKGTLVIQSNLQLKTLDGLAGISAVASLCIKANPKLTSLKSLGSITVLRGNLEITNNTHLASLSGLDGLTLIQGYFELFLNSSLSSLSGLNKLTQIGEYLMIDDNDQLISLADLGVTKLKRFVVKNNTALISLEGLQINSANDIVISSNAALTSLRGLEKIKKISEGIFIYKNQSLTSLSGLHCITTIGDDLNIWGNEGLVSLEGLGKITKIGGELHIADNGRLTSVDGLENVISVKMLSIENNVRLHDFCAIQELFTKGVLESHRIKYNRYNPTLVELRDSRCSDD